MDDYNDKPSEAVVKKIFFAEGYNINLVPVTLERRNADSPKIKAKTTLKYKQGITQSASIRSSSPSSTRTSGIATGTVVSKHSHSIDMKKPNTTLAKSRSAPSSLSGSIVRSPPTSKFSTPPSFVSSRSTTPVRDTIIENQNSSRRTFGGQGTDGLWPSMRSLYSSFQSEYFVNVSKKDGQVGSTVIDHTSKKSTIAASERKRIPLIGRNISEQSKNPSPVQDPHSRVVDQHRWPAMKGGKVSAMTLSRSVDVTDRIGKAASFMLQSHGYSPTRKYLLNNGIKKSSIDDIQLAYSEATTKAEHGGNLGTNIASPFIQKGKLLPSINPSKSLSLPMVSPCRPSSPCSASARSSSVTKRTPSPSSTRSSSPSSSSNNTNKVGVSRSGHKHTFDIRKVIKSTNMEDFHQLRLLYNRELQWHFVNSKLETTLANQKVEAENIFCNVWNVISKLQDYVSREKHKIETLKQEMKLDMLLKEQVSYLEDWIALEGEYSASLFRTIEALRASTLRIPVTGGARVDLRAVKNAFSSAIDIMQAMGSSVCYLFSRVEGTKNLLCQLSTVITKERQMLDECRVLLAAAGAMKLEECKLRAQILQQLRQDAYLT